MKYVALTFLLPLLALAWPGAALFAPQESAGSEVIELGGIRADPSRGLLSIPAQVVVRTELLEYLLVGPRGAAHETLFATGEDPELFHAALLLLGATPGSNATWTPVEPPPTLEERRAGQRAYDVAPPEGEGFHLYAAWRDDGETYFFRVEDLVANLQTGRSMRRHGWVFLGSKFIDGGGGEEVFAASAEGNLINISYFQEGHTLFTCALPECVEQSIWVANAWLVPPRDEPVLLLVSREPLEAFPGDWPQEPPAISAAEEGDGRDG